MALSVLNKTSLLSNNITGLLQFFQNSHNFLRGVNFNNKTLVLSKLNSNTNEFLKPIENIKHVLENKYFFLKAQSIADSNSDFATKYQRLYEYVKCAGLRDDALLKALPNSNERDKALKKDFMCAIFKLQNGYVYNNGDSSSCNKIVSEIKPDIDYIMQKMVSYSNTFDHTNIHYENSQWID